MAPSSASVTRSMWLADCEASLRKLLASEPGFVEAFGEFLRGEQMDGELRFYEDVMKLRALAGEARAARVVQVHETYLSEVRDGVGHRKGQIQAQQRVSSRTRRSSVQFRAVLDPAKLEREVEAEAEATIQCLALDAFPRFAQSKQAAFFLAARAQSGLGIDELDRTPTGQTTGSRPEKTADDWLKSLLSLAHTWPASVVVVDMSLSDTPLVYVNPEFEAVTGYARDEVLGKNCRLLQGPDTETDAVEVIRRTLGDAQDCQVLITNYKKSGERFRQILTLRPVSDRDGRFRFAVGLQLAVGCDRDAELAPKLVRCQKLMQLVPSKLDLASAPDAAARLDDCLLGGGLSDPDPEPRVGPARHGFPENELVVDAHPYDRSDGVDVLSTGAAPSGQQHHQVHSPVTLSPLERDSTGPSTSPGGERDADDAVDTAAVLALTRLAWLRRKAKTIVELLACPATFDVMDEFLNARCHPLLRLHARFVAEATNLFRTTDPAWLEPNLIRLHRTTRENPFLYCVPCTLGPDDVDQVDWERVLDETRRAVDVSSAFLAEHLLPRVLATKHGASLISTARRLEMEGTIARDSAARTCAFDRSPGDESTWLRMFSAVCSAEFRDVGIVVVDARVPGFPLIGVNETGCAHVFSREDHCPKLGENYSDVFFTTKDDLSITESAFLEALRNGKPLCVKLRPVGFCAPPSEDGADIAGGCLVVVLHPIFDDEGQYLYQIGVHVNPSMPDVRTQIQSASSLLDALPGRTRDSVLTHDDDDIESLGPLLRLATASSIDGGQPATDDDQFFDHPLGRKFRDVEVRPEDVKRAVWASDAERALRALIATVDGANAFGAFLSGVGRRAHLDFYFSVEKLKEIPSAKRERMAEHVRREYQVSLVWDRKRDKNNAPSFGRSDDRTAATTAVWKRRQLGAKDQQSLESFSPYQQMLQEQRRVLQMLAVDAFPRFMLSEHSQIVGTLMHAPETADGEFAKSIDRAGATLPQDADEWLHSFIAVTETWPAAIVISDMTVPGAPIVYANPEFSRVTEYAYEDSVGRNCRFLQGPETEPDALAVIRRSLAKGRDCHVLVTNYKKSGAKFKNLLSMRPLYDADDVYRYVVGIQFEISPESGTMISSKLGLLEKLLCLLPSKLAFSGKSDDENAVGFVDWREQAERKASVIDLPQRHAFTKVAWLLNPRRTTERIVADVDGATLFGRFLERSPLARTALDYCECAHRILASSENTPEHDLFDDEELFSRLQSNALFTSRSSSSAAATDAKKASTSKKWPLSLDEIERWREIWIECLASVLRPFLNSVLGTRLILSLHKRELEHPGADFALSTVGRRASGTFGEPLWLDMLASTVQCEENRAECDGIGVVVCDMRRPSAPLVYVSGGFKTIAGYGSEVVGEPCSMLQGPKSQPTIIDELVGALRQAKPCAVKLNNYRKNGDEFQCLVVSSPVWNEDEAPNRRYCYQVGLQIDFGTGDADAIQRQLSHVADFCRYLPRKISGLLPHMTRGEHVERVRAEWKSRRDEDELDALVSRQEYMPCVLPLSHKGDSSRSVQGEGSKSVRFDEDSLPTRRNSLGASYRSPSEETPRLRRSSSLEDIHSSILEDAPVLEPEPSVESGTRSNSRATEGDDVLPNEANHATPPFEQPRKLMCTVSTMTDPGPGQDDLMSPLWGENSAFVLEGTGGRCADSGLSPRPPSKPGRGRQFGPRAARTRPKSAPKTPTQRRRMSDPRCQDDSRLEQIMAKYGVGVTKQSLLTDQGSALKMRRTLGRMLESELDGYRSIFDGSQNFMSPSDSRGAASLKSADVMDLKSLKADRQLFQRLGFVEHVTELDEKIEKIDAMKRDAETKKMRSIMDRRLRRLDAIHRQRMGEVLAEHAKQIARVRGEHALQENKLAQQHHRERKSLLGRTLRLATGGDDVTSTECDCVNPFTCRHNRTASYRLRKPNPMTVKYRAAAERLRRNRRIAEALDYDAKADEIDNAERIAWTKHVEKTAVHCQLPRLVRTQEQTAIDLRTKHEAIIRSMQERQSEQANQIQKVLQCERAKLQRRLAQRVRDAEKGRFTNQQTLDEEMASIFNGDVSDTASKVNLNMAMSPNVADELKLLCGSFEFTADTAGPDDALPGASSAPSPKNPPTYTPPWEQEPVDGLDNSRPLLLV